MNCRDWLRQNGYEDVVALIDEVEIRLKKRGSKQRRNWWEVLAGNPGGKPHICEGLEFPVLRVAQIRQGLPVTPNAITRRLDESPPEMRTTGRWVTKRGTQPS